MKNMTRLRWILGYMRLEIWRKIDLSEADVFAKRYALAVVHATIGFWFVTDRAVFSAFYACIL